MGTRTVLLVAALAALLAQTARADVRSDAVRLLAHRVRQTGVEPRNIAISGVVVSGDQALLSWDSGKRHGIMVLVLSEDRWWDALDMTLYGGCWATERSYPLIPGIPYPDSYMPGDYEPPPDSQMLLSAGLRNALVTAASVRNDDVQKANQLAARNSKPGLVHPFWCNAATYALKPDVAIRPGGGTIHPAVRRFTSGYDITIAYAANDATPDAKLTQLFARAPTLAEFAPNHAPAPGFGGPDSVAFFDLQIAGSKPVTFASGTTIDIWFPFVLDDQLRYNLTFFSADKPSGMIFGTIFDNALHFVLPQFTMAPDKPLMAEIDGDPKGAS